MSNAVNLFASLVFWFLSIGVMSLVGYSFGYKDGLEKGRKRGHAVGLELAKQISYTNTR